MAYEIKEEMDPAETVVAIDFDGTALTEIMAALDRAEFELSRSMLLQRDGHPHAGISLQGFRARTDALRAHRKTFVDAADILRGVQQEQRERIADIQRAAAEREAFEEIVARTGESSDCAHYVGCPHDVD